jgi:hypothetical protein
MISQINYLGCVFRPTDQQLNSIQEKLNSFVKKNLKISDDRLYLQAEEGGVGFFNLQSFLDAQRCTWLFRAKKQCIDNWRYDLHALAPRFDPLLIRKVDIDMYEHPMRQCIL